MLYHLNKGQVAALYMLTLILRVLITVLPTVFYAVSLALFFNEAKPASVVLNV